MEKQEKKIALSLFGVLLLVGLRAGLADSQQLVARSASPVAGPCGLPVDPASRVAVLGGGGEWGGVGWGGGWGGGGFVFSASPISLPLCLRVSPLLAALLALWVASWPPNARLPLVRVGPG